jgi:hypothetical protein
VTTETRTASRSERSVNQLMNVLLVDSNAVAGL